MSGLPPLISKSAWLEAGDGVEKYRLLYRRNQGMPDAAQHHMVWPDGQIVFVALFQLLGIMQQVRLAVLGGDVQAGGDAPG